MTVITFASVKRFGLLIIGLMGLDDNKTVGREGEVPGIFIPTIQDFFPEHQYSLCGLRKITIRLR
jgi:hypothetical protein